MKVRYLIFKTIPPGADTHTYSKSFGVDSLVSNMDCRATAVDITDPMICYLPVHVFLHGN